MTNSNQQRQPGDLLRSRGFKLIVVFVLFAFLIWFVYHLRHIFNPVLIGGLMAYIFEPMVRALVKRGLSRRLSVMTVYVVMLVTASIVISISAVALKNQVEELSIAIPNDEFVDVNQNRQWDPYEKLIKDHNKNGQFDLGYRGRLQMQIADLVSWWNEQVLSLAIEREEFQQSIKENLDGYFSNGDAQQDTNRVMSFIMQSAGGFGLLLMGIIMIPIYGFFLQSLAPGIKKTVPALIPEAVRYRTLSIIKKIDRELSAFFRGKVIVCLLKGFLTYLALQFLGLRFAFFIGFLAGALSIIPYLGAVVGFLIAALISLLDTGSFDGILWITLVFVLMEVIEFFLNIIVFGKEVGIHPLAFILALFIGGELFGLFGVIMAVPLVSVITILYKEFVAPLLTELAQPVQ